MTQPYITGKSPDFAILLAFISGIITLLFGILNLGFLVQFISSPVISGFTTAAAITIASGQVKSLFGLPGKGTEFLKAWENFFTNIRHIQPWDTLLGVVCIVILLLLKKVGQHGGSFTQLAKYLSLSRNALVVFAGTFIAYVFSLYDLSPFQLTGNIGKGLPPFRLPPFSTVVNNQTVEFSEMINELGSAVISIPLISILETVTIATIFCGRCLFSVELYDAFLNENFLHRKGLCRGCHSRDDCCRPLQHLQLIFLRNANHWFIHS